MTIVKGEKYTRVRLQQTVQRRVTYTYVLMDVTVRQQEDTVCEMLKHRCSEQNDGRHHEILNHPAPARPTSLSLSLSLCLQLCTGIISIHYSLAALATLQEGTARSRCIQQGVDMATRLSPRPQRSGGRHVRPRR
jgi:hypothetical protein